MDVQLLIHPLNIVLILLIEDQKLINPETLCERAVTSYSSWYKKGGKGLSRNRKKKTVDPRKSIIRIKMKREK